MVSFRATGSAIFQELEQKAGRNVRLLLNLVPSNMTVLYLHHAWRIGILTLRICLQFQDGEMESINSCEIEAGKKGGLGSPFPIMVLLNEISKEMQVLTI